MLKLPAITYRYDSKGRVMNNKMQVVLAAVTFAACDIIETRSVDEPAETLLEIADRIKAHAESLVARARLEVEG